MRSPETAVLLTTLLSLPAFGGEAYDKLYRLYDYPKTLTRGAVPVCFHHGCESVKHVALTDAHWQRLSGFFEPPAASAEEERAQIRNAIAEMEQITRDVVGRAG